MCVIPLLSGVPHSSEMHPARKSHRVTVEPNEQAFDIAGKPTDAAAHEPGLTEISGRCILW